MRFVVVLLLFLPSFLWASVPYPKYSQLGSQLGAVVVKPLADGSQQVYINGLEIGGVRAAQVYLHGVYNHKADGSQSVLLSLRFAQAGCFDSWLVIRITGNRIMPSAPFGGCAEMPGGFIVDERGVNIVFSHPDPRYVSKHFRYDAQGFVRKEQLVSELQHEEGSDDGPLPDLDWRKWIGRDSHQFLQDPQERFRLQYTGIEAWKALLQQTRVGGAMFSDGKFLYGYGCAAAPCNTPQAVFSISLGYGYPRYIFHDKNGQRKIGGGTLSRFPERVRQFYYTGVFSH